MVVWLCGCVVAWLVVIVEWLMVLEEKLLSEGLTYAKKSLIFVGKMCVLFHVQLRLSLSLGKTVRPLPKWVVDFAPLPTCGERPSQRHVMTMMKIVSHSDSEGL